MTQAPTLGLPDFSKVFEAARDGSRMGIRGVLSQDGHLIAFNREKLILVNLNYSTYDRESYI